MRKNLPIILIGLAFLGVAVGLWQATGNFFYFLNFAYIGGSLTAGIALFSRGWKWARHFTQLAVGLYMLIYLGLIERENMQIEGLWYFLALGVFSGPVIHYAVAKVFGPLLFGRGWCGYACWTAMVLDLLPYKTRQTPRRHWEPAGYVIFAGSIAFVAAVLTLAPEESPKIIFAAFIIGNLAYYLVGTILALALKDNRAFCKYLCPVAVIIRLPARFAKIRVRFEENRCVGCHACERACPMDVNMRSNDRGRLRGNECILCGECAKVCPKEALTIK